MNNLSSSLKDRQIIAIILLLTLGLSLCMPISVHATSSDMVFAAPSYYPSEKVLIMLTEDVNNNGNEDLVLGTGLPGKVLIMLGNEDGTFQNPDVYDFGQYAAITGLAMADFNGDGKVDIIISNQNGKWLRILYGEGDGTFNMPTFNYPVGTSPQKIEVVDLNNDGKLDVVISQYTTDNGVGILMGKEDEGDGRILGNFVEYLPGHRIYQTVTADFNGNGYLDIAAGSYTDGKIYVLFNDESGGFEVGSTIDTGLSSVSTIAAAHMNADAHIDLICSSSNVLKVLLGQGDGNFDVSHSTSGGRDLAIADFNGNNKLDIAMTAETNQIRVMAGNGDGTLQAAKVFYVQDSSQPTPIAYGDFDGDGAYDLAFGEDLRNRIGIMRNTRLDKISNVVLSSIEHLAGSAKSIQLTVTTNGIGDGTNIRADFLTSEGELISPSIEAVGSVINNEAILQLNIPDNLPYGNYLVRIDLDGGAEIYESPYQIYSYGTIAWEEDTIEVDEGSGELILRFSRSGGSKGNVGLGYTLNGTAVLLRDYEKAGFWGDGWILSSGDEKTIEAKFNILDNGIYTGDQTFTITLTITSGLADGLPATATVTIKEKDSANDATLKDLTIEGTTVNGFDSAIYSYDVQLPYGTMNAPSIAAIANHIDATLEITQAVGIPGTARVKVTAEDNTTELNYEVNFSVTEVESVSIETQPKLEYTEGEALDLSGLKVKLHWSNGTEEEVEFADFIAKGLTVDKIDGTTLATTDNGSTITIAHTSSGKTVETNNLTVHAIPTTYTVTFEDWDGYNLKTETVEEGNGATPPDNPSRPGYIFTGWDKVFNNITSHLTVTAQYIEDVPTITDQEKVSVDKAALNIGFAAGDSVNSVTQDISLTSVGAVYGSDITWSSDNEGIIKINATGNSGITTRPTLGSGDTDVTVTAFVYHNGASDTRDFNLIVLQLQPPTPPNVTISIGKTNVTTYGGSNGSITVTAYGGSGTYEYSKDNGLTWQDSNVFKGLGVGTYRVLARDYSDTSNESTVSTVNISSPNKPSGGSSGGGGSSSSLSINRTNPTQGTLDRDYTYSLRASGGSGAYSFEVTSGKLPEGLTISKDGVISGTPTKAGTYQYTITVTDRNGRISRHSFTQIIEEGEIEESKQETIEGESTPKKQIKLTIGKLETTIDEAAYYLDAFPFIDGESNRTLVPLRFISQTLGAEVKWLPETRQVLITEEDTEILLTIGSKEVLVNGEMILMDTEPRIIPPGRTFVPLRFVSEILGATVEYNHETREISITK
ncbi:repeat domain (List_Bact_rpt) [Natronincola peptidivorans]|uniref:Repeat domain (List_Bact_rpt) n=1 Tax=Natronincola peptidivorans TaxID=426128 RepID=A0A1I0DPR0_9FIRM|nr:FG-GAP-like repeat-containing protein [Natronincola peptidivorans]SET34525.1 repeat domain (List_Bact_rpt) [Natronincola peptidivorans]